MGIGGRSGMSEELFRPEAVAYRNRRLLGDLSLAIPPSIRIVAAVAACLFALLAGLLIFLEFNERATVYGWVRPSTGIVRVRAPEDCTVTKVYVREGQKVRVGEPIMQIVIGGKISSEDSFGSVNAASLGHQRELRQSIDSSRQIGIQKQDEIVGQIASKRAEIAQVENQMVTQVARLKIVRNALEDIGKLKDKGFVSKLEVQRRTDAVLTAQNELSDLEREKIVLQEQARSLQSQSVQLAAQSEFDRSAIRGRSYELEGESAIRGSRTLTVFATVDGVIAALHALPNQTALKAGPLVAILPNGGTMQAEMFVPASAIGRVKIGQRASILYDSFPFQRYGADSARIVSISNDVISPSELPIALPITKPVYRVTAELAPRVTGKNDKFVLRPAMSFRADIVVARKHAWQLIIKPVQSVTKR
jgi:membrane fusion protein